MDGFTLIPKKEESKPIQVSFDSNFIDLQNTSENNYVNNNQVKVDYAPLEENHTIIDDEIVEKETNQIEPSSLGLVVLIISILLLLGVLIYTGYLFFLRQFYITQINDYATQLQALDSKINKNEIEDLKKIDKALLTLKSRLDNHIISTRIFDFLNKNIRNSIQVLDYEITNEQNGVSVSFSCDAPNFKDMTEQSEKLIELTKNNKIQKFSIADLSYDGFSQRVKFTIKVVFNKKDVNANNSLTL